MRHLRSKIACGAGLVAAGIVLTGWAPLTARTADRIVYDWAYPVGKQKPRPNLERGIFWMNSDGTGKTQLTATDGYNEGLACWAPDGSRIAYVRAIINGGTYADTLWTMNPDGSGKTPINLPAQDLGFPSWSPDGTYIAIEGTAQNSNLQVVHLLKPNGTGLVDVLVVRQYPYFDGQLGGQESWSPDLRPNEPGYQGMLIFRFVTSQPGGPSYWDPRALSVDIVNGVLSFPNGTTVADSVEAVSLPTGSGLGLAHWSPDGRRMAWVGVGGTYVADLTVDASGWPVLPVSSASAYPIAPNYGGCYGWSWDSQWLVMTSNYVDGGIWKVSVPPVLAGAPPLPIRLGTDSGGRPNWSPAVF